MPVYFAFVFIISSMVCLGALEESSTINAVSNDLGGSEDVCSGPHLDTHFIDPSGCPHGGDEFRLCTPGTRKLTHCVNDGMEMCKFCTNGTFMDKNNNCTECKPCVHQCGPNEVIEIACNAYADTTCRPKPTPPATTILTTTTDSSSRKTTHKILSTIKQSTTPLVSDNPPKSTTSPPPSTRVTDHQDDENWWKIVAIIAVVLHVIVFFVRCSLFCVNWQRGKKDAAQDQPGVQLPAAERPEAEQPDGEQPDNGAPPQIYIDDARKEVTYIPKPNRSNNNLASLAPVRQPKNIKKPSCSATNSMHALEDETDVHHTVVPRATETPMSSFGPDDSLVQLLGESEGNQSQRHRDAGGDRGINVNASTSAQAGNKGLANEIDWDDLDEVEPDGLGFYDQLVKPAWPSREQCTEFDEYYNMTSKEKGFAFIMNNKSFPDHPTLKIRRGSEVDLANMTHLWKQIGYRVFKHEDLKGKEIMVNIREFSALCNTQDCGSAVIFLMSHGSQGYIQGTDLANVLLKDIQQEFDEIHCPNLKEKPKLFFYQACRQLGDEEIVNVVDAEYSIPEEHAHMLVAYATPEGYFSVRSPKTGSWFVNAISAIFIQRVHLDDIDTLLRKVNKHIAKKMGKSLSSGVPVQQTSEYLSRLQNTLYFLPKFYYDKKLKQYIHVET